MEKSYADFVASGDSGTIPPSDWTEYTYHLHGSRDAALFDGLKDQSIAIPYALAFDANIGRIDITQPSGRRRFCLTAEEASSGGLRLVTVEVSQDGHETLPVRFAVARGDNMAVAFPVTSDDEVSRLQSLGNTPRLFKFLPLLGTAHIGLPGVFHSAAFRPTEERDGLYLSPEPGPETEANKRLLTACVRLLGELAQMCSAAGWGNLHELLRVHPPDDGAAPWIEDVEWYRDLQQQLLETLATKPLIRNGTGQLIPPVEAVIPTNDPLLGPEVMLRFSAPVYGKALPEAALAADLSRTVVRWTAILDTNHPLIKACVLNVSRLLAVVRESGNLSALASRLAVTNTEALEWMNELIAAFPESERRTTFDGLLADQTGTFRPHAELSRDGGIDEALKDALEALGEPLRRSLLHRDMRLMDAAIPRVEAEDRVVPRLKERLKKRADVSGAPTDATFRTTCLSAFQWFADRERWKDLQDSFPVFTLDREGIEALQRTASGGPKLLAPRTVWPEPARAFWDAFPPRTVLADDYGPLLSPEVWSRIGAAGVLITDLVWPEHVDLTDEQLERLVVDRVLDGDHAVKADGEQIIIVKRLALVRSEEFYESIRKSQERAARFLRFVLEYLATADPSWEQRQDVPCECGKTHSIVPCDWLAWIRRTQWVPRGKHAEHASTESLASLARRDPELAALMTHERTQSLLELLGVNILEQTLLSVDESQRPAMRRKLAELTKVLKDPAEIDGLVKDLEIRRQVSGQWASNQTLGRKVEEVVKAVLEGMNVNVKVHFRGYDLDAYLGALALPDEDIGHLELGVAKIEIKATRSDAVSMSDVQAGTATADPQRYWLCVLSLDSDESVESLTTDYVHAHARFVPGIGDILSKPRAELGDAVEVARVAGVELQHVDAIRYRVGRLVWENRGLSVDEFVQCIVARVRERAL